MDYDFSGQDNLSYVPESNTLGNFGDLSDDLDNKEKKKKETPYDFSGQEGLFPKSQQLIETPKAKITSKFGNRNDPFGAGIKFHNGVDIPMVLNTPVNSLGRGTVIDFGDTGKKDYGRSVKVDYGGGLILEFGHLNKILVERGDKVSPEAILGLSGSTGRSKGPHLHIKATLNGKSVNPEDYFGNIHDIAIGALTNEDVVKDKSYDFSGQDEINSSVDDNNPALSNEFDFTGQDQIGEVREIVETPYVDRRTFEEKAASGAASLSQPKITISNPNQLLGDRITAIIPVKGVNKPDINTLTDSWLSSVDPSYSRINSEYRGMTGRNLIHFDGTPEYIGDNKYKLTARLTKGSVDLINAYIEGRNKGGPEAGWENAYHKSLEIKRQEQAVKEEVSKIREEDKNTFAKKHPYLATALNVVSPISLLATDPQATKAGISNIGTSDAQLVHNLRMLPEALYKLYRYGGDSEEYEALIERDREIQKNLFGYQSEIQQPETLTGKVTAGAITGFGALPKFAFAGSTGVAGLPLLVYAENLHRGNREASIEALKMVLMGGVTHGFGEYLNSGTKIYLNTVDESGNPVNKVIEVGRGLGNKAVFSRVKGELSLNPKTQSAFIAKDPVSIASFSPLEKQILMRGTNALLMGASTAIEGGSLQDTASNFIVGLTFPVGKYRVGSFDEGKLNVATPVDSPATEQILTNRKLLGQSRVEVSLTSSPTFGESNLPIIENARGIPTDSPRNLYSTKPDTVTPNLEKGFQAKGSGQTLFLDMDTAALNLLDLRRGLTDKSFVGTGNVGLKNSITRQIAIQKAIGVLQAQIPKDVVDYIEQNEGLIRSALKTNYEAVKAKEEYLGNRQTLKEIKTPDEIKINDSIETKESPIDRLKRGLEIVRKNPELVQEASETVFGTNGFQNKWITPDRALFAYERFTKRIGERGNLITSEKGTFDPRAFSDLAVIAAFHLEDFYHRKIEPSFVELKNRFKITLGDTIKNVADEDLRNAYDRGNEILQTNIADPFFSKMKQDALERLPNKFTEEQARNILSQHKDELEWTSGLKEFLEENKDKRISKQELVDIIQKGQVRVDESIAQETPESGTREFVVQNRLSQIEARLKELDNYLEPKNVEQITNDNIEWNKLLEEQSRLQAERSLFKDSRPKYSLSSYRYEKLELPGAKNSKEVKLVTPLVDNPLGTDYTRNFSNFLSDSLIKQETFDRMSVSEREPIIRTYIERGGESSDVYFKQKEYKSPHWDEPNVVAHYRANDRISTDNKRIYFGEEFQSDWNHDIRTLGVKPDVNKLREELNDLSNRQYKENNTPIDAIFAENGKLSYEYDHTTDEARKVEIAKQLRENDQKLVPLYDNNQRINERVVEIHKLIDSASRGVEPNPFVQHNWKELVLKRFLRDAVVAKDENGNYKYDAIGWTTARQQLERYGGILEGKTFRWRKNPDRSYTFDFGIHDLTHGYENDIGWSNPHELQNISLERFAELTTKEAADFVREQEAKREAVKDAKFEVRSPEGFLYGTYNTEEEAITRKNELAPATSRAARIIRTGPHPREGQFSLSETVELRSREGTYADYDVAYKNILSKIGKRFGAKYSEREIETGTDLIVDRTDPNNFGNTNPATITHVERINTEKIHSLEITPSMRQSLEKEGLPLYGTGGSEALKASEFGIRNKIVTTDAFNEARNDLVQKLSNLLYHASPFEFDIAHSTGRHSEGWTYFTNNKEYAEAIAETVKSGYMGKFHPIGAKYAKDAIIYTAAESPTKTPLDLRELKGSVNAVDLFNILEKNGVQLSDSLKEQLQRSKPIGDMVDYLATPELRVELRKAAIEKGFDGLIVHDEFNGINGESHVAFNPTKVSKPTVFNSGLNPDAFIDQIKLLYSGIKDLAEFTNRLVERYGEPIRQFAEDFYFAIKDTASEFNKKLDIKLEEWNPNLNKLKDQAAFQIRQFAKSEEGSFKLPLKKLRDPELEDYYTDKTKHQIPIGLDYRAWLRGIGLAQFSTEFSKVHDTLRVAQRVVHSYNTSILNELHLAKKIIRMKLDKPVAEAIYEGNETQKVFTDPELTARGLNSQQIDSYRNIRAAVDNVLNLRLEGKLYAVNEKAQELNAKFMTLTPGTPEYDSIANELLDLQNAKTKMVSYYQKLKDEGYVTIQRRGRVAAFLEDPNYPVGDPKRKIYNQFNSAKEANEWIQKQKLALKIPKATLAGSIYDIRNLKDIALKEKLTPSQFEDLVDRSGASSGDPEIEKIRTEVYSKFPSFTYQLDREFVRGYDRDLQTAIDSTVHQAELYSSSFYSKVGGEEGMKALEATGLEKSDPNLYKIASQYIKDETSPAELNWLSKKAIQARRLTYLWQLAGDVNQLYLNALAQPITQTYGYFSRVSYNGIKLSGLEPEHYFLKAGKLAGQAIKAREAEGIVAKGIKFASEIIPGTVIKEFNDIVAQLTAEHVLAPEFTKSLIESKTGTGKVSKVEHWASAFMRNGEKVTRTHAAAEAYLVGKEKFNLAGDDLIKFIVRAVDATQSNPTRGENPYVIRQLGEPGKLVYQFLAFNQMWLENLAIGVKDSKGIVGKSLFAAREFAPLAIIGGISGLPLASFAGTAYTLLTGRDPKKDADKFLGDDTFIEQLVRYGITTSAAFSQKLTPTAPVLDQAGRALTADFSGGIGTLADSVPAFATADQLIRGASQIYSGKTLKGIANLSPRAIKGPIKTIEAANYGFRTPSGKSLLSKGKQTKLQLAGQLINISPTPVIEKYDRERTLKLKKNKIFKKLRKAI